MNRKGVALTAAASLAALLFGAVWLGVPMAVAQPLAVVEGQPVSVSADHLSIDVHKGTAVLSGHVQMKRGELVIRCERVDARYDEAPNLTWARATGEVVADWRDLHARANEAELVSPKKVLLLRGGVKVWRAGAWIEAREAQVDFATGRLTLEQVSGSIPVGSAQPRWAADAAP